MACEAVLALDVGGSHVKGALVAMNGELIATREWEHPLNLTRETLLCALLDAADTLLKAHPTESANLLGIGLALPGAYDVHQGVVLNAPHLPFLNGFCINDFTDEKFRFPVWIENDANAAAAGEHWVGVCAGEANLYCLMLGSGIGGGLILDGHLYQGPRGTAGEVGHMKIFARDSSGHERRVCSCGRRGCLEAYASGDAIAQEMRRRLTALRSDLPPFWKDHIKASFSSVSAKEVFEAALQGDRLAKEVLSEAGECIGVAISNIAVLLGIDHFVIGGKVAGAADFLIPAIVEGVEKNRFAGMTDRLTIRLSDRPDDAVLFGLAYLVQNRIINYSVFSQK